MNSIRKIFKIKKISIKLAKFAYTSIRGDETMKQKQKCKELPLLLKEIEKSKIALDTALSNFDNMTEPDLIDCYIYELQAAQTRYKYLIRQAKNDELRFLGSSPVIGGHLEWNSSASL